ncbi:MAG: DNA-3-methyladenine glycosylase [Firmicutes bacterium]|nr:DNA-3-methyladenine glycosylase [Bacillota bacterium]
MRITNKEFFNVDVLELAKNLLGKILCRKTKYGEILQFRITETEAYGGTNDSASHAHRGKTKRNAPMFEHGGTIYVYLCYGIHKILNIASGHAGDPQGVMIRGINEIYGPGKVTKALEISRDLSGADITTSPELWLENDDFQVNNIKEYKRIGIGYATQQDQDKLWRFRIDQ